MSKLIQIASWTLLWIILVSPSWSQDELSEFKLHPACELQLVAKEPQVVDPIAVRFDERGRMWVVEMRDYPTLDSALPSSKIKILEDKDHDGYYESATVFADHLMFPTGIQPWKNGVIATVEGQVVYLADNDGDQICDEEQVLFRGFAKKNTQLRANHPTFAPDGKIYVANGLRNGEVVGPRSRVSIPITGMDFCFDPVTMECEAVTGYGQFGMAFDQAGHRYTCTNRNPLKRIVFEARYLKASSGIRVSQTVADVAAAGPDSRLFPISQTWTTSNLHANQFTAACGVHLFDGDQLPPEFQGNAFTCDPTANVVHREVISYQQDSVIGTAKPGRSKIEFLASTNPEFRPVNLNGGPDGALYVVDMRRTVIEHPQFMPPELKRRPDLRLGKTKGRIYRVCRKKESRAIAPIKLVPEVDLFSQMGWKREAAHRLLVQSPDEFDLQKIRQGLSQPSSHPNGLIRGLSFLQSLNELRPIDYQFAVSHYSAAVRSCGMKLCEAAEQKLLLNGVMDESDQVRFQSLLSLTQTDLKIPLDLLETVAWNSAANRWVQTALLLATSSQANPLLERLLQKLMTAPASQQNKDHVWKLCEQLIPLAAAQDQKHCEALLRQCFQSISSDGRALESMVIAFLQAAPLHSVANSIRQSSEVPIESTRQWLRKRITGEQFNESQIQLLAMISREESLIETIALDDTQPVRQLAAVKAMHSLPQNLAWNRLAERYRTLPFALRNEVLRAAYGRASVATQLINLVAQKKLSVNEIALNARQRLQAHSDPAVRKVARQVLKVTVSADRRQAFEKYQSALSMAADAKNGRLVFEKTCATCHQLGKLGHRIGPDISDTRTKSKSQLLLDIIRPNAAIDNNFVEYVVETVDGVTIKGIIIENNSTGITLKQPGGKTVSISRDEIERMQSTGKSLMPVGLEQDLSLQQVADLISYLQNWRYLEQNIPFVEQENAK